jgi:hypothetical protein
MTSSARSRTFTLWSWLCLQRTAKARSSVTRNRHIRMPTAMPIRRLVASANSRSAALVSAVRTRARRSARTAENAHHRAPRAPPLAVARHRAPPGLSRPSRDRRRLLRGVPPEGVVAPCPPGSAPVVTRSALSIGMVRPWCSAAAAGTRSEPPSASPAHGTVTRSRGRSPSAGRPITAAGSDPRVGIGMSADSDPPRRAECKGDPDPSPERWNAPTTREAA